MSEHLIVYYISRYSLNFRSHSQSTLDSTIELHLGTNLNDTMITLTARAYIL